VSEPLIERDEIVALLFNVSDGSNTLLRIEALLKDDDEEEEADEG
jgi:hypothetical protein